jgi:hypothetical protein
MEHLSPDDLYTLEAYAKLRQQFRARVMEHKKHRRLQLGEHIVLLFEDRLTMHYQVQEMLRAEKIFEVPGIGAELDAYNPLIPDGSNLKATMMIEYPDASERSEMLKRLVGIEDKVWIQVGAEEKVFAIADEDMERSTEEKTSSIHFLRFELLPILVADLKNGAALRAGVDHAIESCAVEMSAAMHESLIADLD